MYIKPALGRVVRYPDVDRILPQEGAQVPEDVYWTRRLRDGDVVKATPPKPQKEKKVSE